MRQATKRPSVVVVARLGDPVSALAAVVHTDAGSVATTALAAIVEARLKASGFSATDTRSDRDTYRVRLLLANTETIPAFVAAFYKALNTPVAVSSPELQLVKHRWELLRRKSLDSPALVPVYRCTGELGSLIGDPVPDLTTTPGAAQVEAFRKSAHTAERIALAAVGPATVGEALTSAVENGPPWGTEPSVQDAWPEQDNVATYTFAAASNATPTMRLALRVRDPYAAANVAEDLDRPDNLLVGRLLGLGWRIVRAAATARPRGACISVTLDQEPTAEHGSVELDAARVASLVAHELEAELSETRADGSVAGRQVLKASDPRDAASLAAWWALSSRFEPGPGRLAAALGLPPPPVGPADPPSRLDDLAARSKQRFLTEFLKMREAWNRDVVESRTRVEVGQGELWLLAASPCGVCADSQYDAGLTPFAVIAAAHAFDRNDGVALEPWITQNGVGILAHAAPRESEDALQLAHRAAGAAARALMSTRIPDRSFQATRNHLLPLLERTSGAREPGLDAFASAIAPSHPSWLSPFGSFETVVKATPDVVAGRLTSLADGPIRIAVLARVDQAQADAAVHTIDRWLMRRVDHERVCPPTPSIPPMPPTPRDVIVRGANGMPYVLMGIALARPDRRALMMLDLLAEGLDGSDGWLARALSSLSTTTATVRIVGGSTLSALVIDIAAPQDVLDSAVRQARAVLQRLAKGAATDVHLQRAAKQLAERNLLSRLDPRQRVADLWNGRDLDAPVIDLPSWNAWLRQTLVDDALVTVRTAGAQPPLAGK